MATGHREDLGEEEQKGSEDRKCPTMRGVKGTHIIKNRCKRVGLYLNDNKPIAVGKSRKRRT
jgi:hypothetical protein